SASSAAQSLRAAVPGALQTALAAICHAQRQGDRDIDVLVGVGAVKEMDEAVGGVAATRRHDGAAGRFDSRCARKSVRWITRENCTSWQCGECRTRRDACCQ